MDFVAGVRGSKWGFASRWNIKQFTGSYQKQFNFNLQTANKEAMTLNKLIRSCCSPLKQWRRRRPMLYGKTRIWNWKRRIINSQDGVDCSGDEKAKSKIKVCPPSHPRPWSKSLYTSTHSVNKSGDVSQILLLSLSLSFGRILPRRKEHVNTLMPLHLTVREFSRLPLSGAGDHVACAEYEK